MLTTGNWVADSSRVARIKNIHDDGSLDLVLYSRAGNSIGRQSPAMGGPRGYEPCCDRENWKAIKPPVFPLMKNAYIEEIVEYV